MNGEEDALFTSFLAAFCATRRFLKAELLRLSPVTDILEILPVQYSRAAP